MSVVARALACALVGLGLVASTAAAGVHVTTTTSPLISDNITPVFTVPGVHPIGARIRGTDMFVTGPEGLTVFDITDPEHPLPEGALPLPHFENEDVDLGGDILLISNDPSEGLGILYVIDISDPTLPTLVSATPNGVIDFCQSCFGAEETVPPGTGHTASCIPGPQGACQYAYLAGTGHGIAIADLTDPAAPVIRKVFKPEITGAATHDVQLDGTGLAWIVGYDGSAAYDVSDPLNPRMVMRTDPALRNTGVIQPGVIPPSANPAPGGVITDPVFGLTVGGSGDTALDFIHHDSLRFAAPAPPAGKTPPPVATDGNPQTVGEPPEPGPQPQPQPAPQGGVQGERHSSPPPKPKARTRKSCKHIKSKAKRRRCFRRHRRQRLAERRKRRAAHSAAVQKVFPAGGGGDIVGIVEEDYARPTCEGAGSFQTWQIGDDDILRMKGTWATEVQALSDGSGFAPVTGVCSAHYFDYRDGLVANAWYEEGTRFLDVSDPAHIKQVGYWIPAKGETWSAIFSPTDPTGQTVYALDVVRGIEVLHIDRKSLKKTSAPVRRSWVRRRHAAAGSRLVRFSVRSRYGWACRIVSRRLLRALS